MDEEKFLFGWLIFFIIIVIPCFIMAEYHARKAEELLKEWHKELYGH